MVEPVIQRKTWDPAENKRGLECRWCGCKHFRVIYTRPAWGGRLVRRRECRNCGKRMTTWEKAGM
jgi:transcriptional regulator NrdR family protein